MIVEGTFVQPEGPTYGQVAIEEGVIQAVGPRLGPADVILPGWVFPGFLDFHVHAREYPRPEAANDEQKEQHRRHLAKETFASAGEAARRGGVVGFAEMPNNPVPPDHREVWEQKCRLAEAAGLPVVVIGAITAGSKPFAEIPYKMMMDRCCGGIAFADLSEAEATLEAYRGHFVIFHCEDPDVLRTGGPGRPPLAEIRAIARVLEWAERFGLDAHVAHISTREGVEAIARHNAAGRRRVSCEVTPHHLVFSRNVQAIRPPYGPLAELRRGDRLSMNPPLREEEDRRALLRLLRDGKIDFVATDHAPHTLADKDAGAPGVAHLETLGPFAPWLWMAGGLSPARVAEVLSGAPGRLFERFLGRRIGRIAPGYEATFTALDPSRGTPVAPPFASRCGWSPFEGLTLPGAVVETWLAGVRQPAATRSPFQQGLEPRA